MDISSFNSSSLTNLTTSPLTSTDKSDSSALSKEGELRSEHKQEALGALGSSSARLASAQKLFPSFNPFPINLASIQPQFINSWLDKQGKPTQALSKLLELTGLNPNTANLDELISQTQNQTNPECWFQKGKERWEFSERFEEKRDEIMPLLDELGIVNAVQAKDKHYHSAFIHGGLAPRVKPRIHHLMEEWNRGVRFEEVVFLTGQRDLDKKQEKEFVDIGLRTEPEMMQHLWESTTLPEGLKSLVLKIADAPKVIGSDGSPKRPSTKDAIKAWRTSNPDLTQKALVISNQPFVAYQHYVMKAEMPTQFDFETIGPAAEKDTKLNLHLHTAAQLFYQMGQVNMENRQT